MRILIAALLGVLIWAIGLDVAVRQKRERVPPQTSIGARLRDMARNGGITDAKAKAASLDIWKQLYSSKANAKVKSCEWNAKDKNWLVTVYVGEATAGSCWQVTISEEGFLWKVEYFDGM